MRFSKGFLTLIVACGLILGWSETIEAQASVTAEVDRSTISTNDHVRLTVIVSGQFASLPAPDISPIQDFAVASRSSSTQVSIINGVQTAQGIYTYILQPLREGMLTIPPLAVSVDGQLYETQPLQVEVIAGSTAPAPPSPSASPSQADDLVGQNLFVEAEVDNINPFLGQQILYIFRFYQAIDFPISTQGRLDYQEPAFTDFWSQTLDQPQSMTTVNGRRYTVTEVRTALFPAGLNEIIIEPARLVVPGGLFNPDVVLETQPIAVNVQSLPPGAPIGFNGAVGQFQLQARLDANEGRVNEPLTLTVEISGRGNINTLTEPVLPEPAFWRFFESTATTNLDPREDGLYGVRRFERLMVPGQPGEFTIPPINFSYYDPVAGQYQVLASDPIPITVNPGEDEFGGIVEPSGLVAGDIQAIKPVPRSLSASRFFSLVNPIFWLCWIIPLFIVAAIWVFQTQRERLSTDVGYARGLRAKRIAQQILKEGEGPDADEMAIVQRALLGYLADKLNRPTTGLTTDNLVKLLKEQKLDPPLVERVRVILAHIQTNRFAPVKDAATRSLIGDTWELINDLEKAFGG